MKDKCLDLTGYFDEDDRIDIQVHTKTDTVIIHDIKPFVNWYDDWFTVEVTGRYATAYYFKSEDVLYFSIVPEQNANAVRNAYMAEEWEDNNAF